MAFTTDWEWSVIDRNYETTVSGGIYLQRRKWIASRTRISNDTYSSEEGTTQDDLSGYNGGVTETVSCPTVSYATVSGTNCSYTDLKWAKTPFDQNSQYSYTPWNGNSNPVWAANVSLGMVLSYKRYNSSGSYYWGISILPQSRILSGNYIEYWFETNYYTNTDTYSSGTLWVGDPTGPCSVSRTSGQLGFFCKSDRQRYFNKGADYYNQTQLWEYVGPWDVTA